MRKSKTVLFLVLILCSCEEPGQAWLHTCNNFGLSYGTPEFAQCMQNQQMMYQQANMAMVRGSQQGLQNQQQLLQNQLDRSAYQSRQYQPINCTTTPYGIGTQTNCQ